MALASPELHRHQGAPEGAHPRVVPGCVASASPKILINKAEYKRLLLARTNINKDENSSFFSKYVGILNNGFTTDDIKYNEIVS